MNDTTSKPISQYPTHIVFRLSKNKLFVEPKDFSIDNIRIVKHLNNSINRMCYNVMYVYSGDEDTGTAIIDKLRMYHHNINIRSNRYSILPRDNAHYRYIKVPYDIDNDRFREMDTVIQLVRTKILDLILKEHAVITNNAEINLKKNSGVYFKSRPDGTLECNVVRLGGVSENNINIKLKTIKDINNVVTDYRYNKKGTDSYYRSNSLIWFSCVIIIPSTNSDTQLYIKACIDTMEMYYNKSKCISTVNSNEKIIVTDNVLVL